MGHIRMTRDGAVGIITIDRPERFNAMDVAMALDFRKAGLQFARAEDVRCVVLRGAGGVFCSGADLKEPRQPGRSQRANKLFSRVEKFSKPTLAAINGYALGGGLEISLVSTQCASKRRMAIGKSP